MNASRKPASVKPAVVLVSGGMDSAVVLAIGKSARSGTLGRLPVLRVSSMSVFGLKLRTVVAAAYASHAGVSRS